MDKMTYNLRDGMRKYASYIDEVAPDEIANFVSVIKLFVKQNPDELDKKWVEMANELPSEYQILNNLSSFELKFLYRTIATLWRQITGESISSLERTGGGSHEAPVLDGCYWLLPGELLISGYNHYDAAKKHRGLLCSALDLNALVFERNASLDPERIIEHIIRNGGVRVLFDRNKSAVYMQCSEEGWPLARGKAKKMYHRKKIIKVLDRKEDYKGWKSGHPVKINARPISQAPTA